MLETKLTAEEMDSDIVSVPANMGMCPCGRQGMHETFCCWETPQRSYQCCRCHVRSGDAPADWHTECMAEYQVMKDADSPLIVAGSK